MRKGTCAFAAVIVLLLGLFGAPAQDRPDTPPLPQTEISSGAAGQEPEAGSEADPAESPPREGSAPDAPRIIYIPFKDLEGTFEKPEAEIVLPYRDYQELLRAWKESRRPREAPEAVVTRADYTVAVEGDLARIRAELTVNVLGEPWVEVPLHFGEAALGQVQGEDVLLRGTGEGRYELLFPSSGEHRVEIELAARIRQTPDGQEFSFSVPPVAVTTLEVTVPTADQEIHVQPRVVALPLEENEQEEATRIRASLGSTEAISVRWHPKATLKPEMDLLSSVSTQTLVNVDDGLVHTDTYLTYDVLRGELEQLRIIVPGDHRILDVSADARVRSWKAETEGENQIVEVELLATTGKKVTVEVHTERKLDGEEFHVAGIDEEGIARGIHALDAVRESGQIAVRHSPDLTLTVAEQRGVVRIEAADVAERLRGTNAFTFRFYSSALTLRMRAGPVEPRITLAHQARFTFDDNELQFINSLRYGIERAGVFELVLQLPEGVAIDDVRAPQMKEFNIDEQSRRLTVSLRERTRGDVSLTIRGHLDLGDAERVELTLPVLEPLHVERETGTILVFARESIELVVDQENLVSAQPQPQPGTGEATPAAHVLQSAWSFTRRPVTIPVRTTRKPTRLSARVGTAMDVQPQLTQVRTHVDYLVEHSGIDTFRFEVPEAVSERVRIDVDGEHPPSAPIRQRTSGEPREGWVVWTVQTQRPVVGRQRFLIAYDLPVTGADEKDAGAAQEIPVLRPLGLVDREGEITTPLTRVQGEIAVQKERSVAVSTTAAGGGIEAIDIRELTLLPKEGTAAYRYFKEDAAERPTVTVRRARHDIQEVVATVVSRGLVEVVAGEDAQATYRCRFLVKSTQRQRLLMYLPINLEVLGAFLNDREIKLERAGGPGPGGPGPGGEGDAEGTHSPPPQPAALGPLWSPFWVNVARSGSSDEPFLLTFQFLWTLRPALGETEYARGKMTLPLPVIGPERTGVVQELKTVIWIPEDYSLVGDPHRFELQKRSRPGSFLLGERANRRTDDLEKWVSGGLKSPSGFARFPAEGRTAYVYSNLGGAAQIDVTWWHRLTMTLILSIAVAVIGWILTRTSWENKLGILLLAAFAAALYGIYDSHGLAQGLAAARFGIVALLGLWLIHALLGRTRGTAPPGQRTYGPADVPYAVIPPPGVFEHLQAGAPTEQKQRPL